MTKKKYVDVIIAYSPDSMTSRFLKWLRKKNKKEKKK